MQQKKKTGWHLAGGQVDTVLSFASPVIILLFCWWAWGTIYSNDWGKGVVLKILLLASFTWFAVGVGGMAFGRSRLYNSSAIAAACGGILLSLGTLAPQYLQKAHAMPSNDIGLTTLSCAQMFWKGEGNPYTSDSVNPRPELRAGYRGFHYGPGMLLCYGGAKFGQFGYQISHFFWISLMIVAGAILASLGERDWQSRLTAVLFFLALVFAAPGWWKEYFQVGVNDAVPLSLMGASLIAISKGGWKTAGVLAGIALSAKFSPAGFLLLALIRRGTPRGFWIGVLAGSVALWVAILIAPEESIRNIFLSRLHTKATPTGLHYLMADRGHELLLGATLLGIAMVVVRGWNQGSGSTTLLKTVTVLACIGILGHKEVHANHATWLLFFGAILLTRGREGVWHWFAGHGESWYDSKDSGKNMNKLHAPLSDTFRPPLPIGK